MPVLGSGSHKEPNTLAEVATESELTMTVNARPSGNPPDPATDEEVDLSSTLGQGRNEDLDALSTRRDALAGNPLSTQAAARAGTPPDPTSATTGAAANSSADDEAPDGPATDRDDAQPADRTS